MARGAATQLAENEANLVGDQELPEVNSPEPGNRQAARDLAEQEQTTLLEDDLLRSTVRIEPVFIEPPMEMDEEYEFEYSKEGKSKSEPTFDAEVIDEAGNVNEPRIRDITRGSEEALVTSAIGNDGRKSDDILVVTAGSEFPENFWPIGPVPSGNEKGGGSKGPEFPESPDAPFVQPAYVTITEDGFGVLSVGPEGDFDPITPQALDGNQDNLLVPEFLAEGPQFDAPSNGNKGGSKFIENQIRNELEEGDGIEGLDTIGDGEFLAVELVDQDSGRGSKQKSKKEEEDDEENLLDAFDLEPGLKSVSFEYEVVEGGEGEVVVSLIEVPSGGKGGRGKDKGDRGDQFEIPLLEGKGGYYEEPMLDYAEQSFQVGGAGSTGVFELTPTDGTFDAAILSVSGFLEIIITGVEVETNFPVAFDDPMDIA